MTPRPAQRLFYRAAYKVLLGWRFLRRPRLEGVAVALLHRDRVLLVRHSYKHRGRWDFPGGGPKRGEAPHDAARREVREELGLALDELVDLGVEEVAHGYCCDAIRLFLARCPSDAATPDGAEIEEARWVPLDGAPPDLSPMARRLFRRALPALRERAARRENPRRDGVGRA